MSKDRTVAEVKGTITMADGSTSEFSIGTDFGWSQWGAIHERLGRSVDVVEAMVSGFQEQEVRFVSDYDPDEEDDSPDEPESATCKVCHERITWDGGEWVHSDGDIYCGTGDGAMALPEDDEEET